MDEDRIKGAATDLGGRAKDAIGSLTGDKKTQAEGKADQTKANAKKAGENVKDAFKH